MKLLFTSFIILLSFIGNSQCLEGDCFNGYGTFKCSCGYIFVGDFKDGEKVYGTLTKEELIYTGEFKNDVAEGQGIIKFIDSTWYEGSFVNTFPEGYGTFHFADGTTYTGEMFEGKFKGLGVMKYANDSSEVKSFEFGEFKEDHLNGFGLMINSTELYFGQLEGGIAQGFGVSIIGSGTVWAGKYKKGKQVHSAKLSPESEKVFFKSEPYKLGKEVFTSEKYYDGNYIQLESVNEEGKRAVMIFNSAKNQMFLFPYNSFPHGRMIDLDGQIFKVHFNEENGKTEIIE